MERTRVLFSRLAGVLLPSLLLFSTVEAVAHGEHEESHECVVCHAGHQVAILESAPEAGLYRFPERVEPVVGTPCPVVRRAVRRPARAPPA